jgi:acetate kinase
MQSVLTINGGSSSIRFALYDAADTSRTVLAGKIDRIGLSDTALTVDGERTTHAVDAEQQNRIADYLLDWLSSHPQFDTIAAVGHRIVHGMQHSRPEHLPRELALLEAVGRRLPEVPQVACFDTAFHRTMPRVATLVPIPRRYQAKGVQRYGFHGLSYTYLMAQLVRLDEAAATRGRVILAHLGSGASLAAVRDGSCIDTSMGFTPTSGLVMSTRSGDLDPGVMGFLAATESMDAAAYEKMVTHESGLLGVSETSADIRDLLAREALDVRAAEAVALFCYQVKKWIGAFAAALGGVDVVVFAGGIGENAPQIRERICAGLEFLGIEMDGPSNARSAALISSAASRVSVRVIPTDEELVIADSTLELLGLKLRRTP